jgi:hypothetical protein
VPAVRVGGIQYAKLRVTGMPYETKQEELILKTNNPLRPHDKS